MGPAFGDNVSASILYTFHTARAPPGYLPKQASIFVLFPAGLLRLCVCHRAALGGLFLSSMSFKHKGARLPSRSRRLNFSPPTLSEPALIRRGPQGRRHASRHLDAYNAMAQCGEPKSAGLPFGSRNWLLYRGFRRRVAQAGPATCLISVGPL